MDGAGFELGNGEGYSGGAILGGAFMLDGSNTLGPSYLNGSSGTLVINGSGLVSQTFNQVTGTFTLNTTPSQGGDLPPSFDVDNLTLDLTGGDLDGFDILSSSGAVFTAGNTPGLYTVTFLAAPEPAPFVLVAVGLIALAVLHCCQRTLPGRNQSGVSFLRIVG